MKVNPIALRSAMPIVHPFRCRYISVFLFIAIVAVPWKLAAAQESASLPETASAPLTAEQVVSRLVQMNRLRLEALGGYQGTRTYRVDYRGFPGDRSAEMVVRVEYQSPNTKELTIESATGSKLIIDKVFKKALEAEKEAQSPDAQRRTTLNTDNYAFTLVGYEQVPGAALYVLQVDPRRKDKFLYRGRIWVDAEEFAVVRLQAEPAKNPSFWTKKAEIEQVYSKVSGFWLPAYNKSVSDIRLGGHAELTIQYDSYKVKAAGSFPDTEARQSSTALNAGP